MDKVLKLGTHLELVPAGVKIDSLDGMEKRYTSSIHEIMDEETIVITNPTLHSRLVPFHKNERYDGYIFSDGKSYVCRMSVSKSALDGRIRVVHMQMLSGIEKYERRQFFRLEVSMQLRYLLITAENSAEFKKAVLSKNLLHMPGFCQGTTLDISGGGIKFLAQEQLPENGLVIINLTAPSRNGSRQYVFLGKILGNEPKEDVRGVYIHRLLFVDLNQAAREEFVRYIFEKERESLKKNGML